jgi:hypothetical protein
MADALSEARSSDAKKKNSTGRIMPLPFLQGDPNAPAAGPSPDPSECESVDINNSTPPLITSSAPKPVKRVDPATANRRVSWSDTVGKKLCEVSVCIFACCALGASCSSSQAGATAGRAKNALVGGKPFFVSSLRPTAQRCCRVQSASSPPLHVHSLQVKVFDPWEDEAREEEFDDGEDYEGSKDACCVIS